MAKFEQCKNVKDLTEKVCKNLRSERSESANWGITVQGVYE